MNMYAKMLVACRTNQYDFISNVSGRTWPVGMSAETVRLSFYESLSEQIQSDPLYYEHVTSFLYANPEIGKRYYITNTRFPEMQGLHLAEHVLLTATLMVFDTPIGLSTLFGAAEGATWSGTVRVWCGAGRVDRSGDEQDRRVPEDGYSGVHLFGLSAP